MHKRSKYFAVLALIILLTSFLLLGCGGKTGGKKTPLPAKDIIPGSGRVWFVPEEVNTTVGSDFTTELHVNSGDQKVAAYGFFISYDKKLIKVNDSIGNSGVEPGPDGYDIAAVNPNNTGQLVIAGFDVYGKGPSKDLNFIKINWKAIAKGTSTFKISVKNLNDEKTNIIGRPVGIQCSVVIE